MVFGWEGSEGFFACLIFSKENQAQPSAPRRVPGRQGRVSGPRTWGALALLEATVMRAFHIFMGPLWFSFNSHPLPAWLLECVVFFFLLICKNSFYSKNRPAGQGKGFGGSLCCFSGVPTHQALRPPCRPTAGLGRRGGGALSVHQAHLPGLPLLNRDATYSP